MRVDGGGAYSRFGRLVAVDELTSVRMAVCVLRGRHLLTLGASFSVDSAHHIPNKLVVLRFL